MANKTWSYDERVAFAKGVEKGEKNMQGAVKQALESAGIDRPRTNDERTDAVTERLDKIIDLLRPVPPEPEFDTRYVNRYAWGLGSQLFTTDLAAHTAAKTYGEHSFGTYLRTVAVKVPRA